MTSVLPEPGNDVVPPSGPAEGDNVVSVIATGITTTEDTVVGFGGAQAAVLGADAASHRVIVEVPPGQVGAVDVTLANGNGSATAPGAYTVAVGKDEWKIFVGPGETRRDFTLK